MALQWFSCCCRGQMSTTKIRVADQFFTMLQEEVKFIQWSSCLFGVRTRRQKTITGPCQQTMHYTGALKVRQTCVRSVRRLWTSYSQMAVASTKWIREPPKLGLWTGGWRCRSVRKRATSRCLGAWSNSSWPSHAPELHAEGSLWYMRTVDWRCTSDLAIVA